MISAFEVHGVYFLHLIMHGVILTKSLGRIVGFLVLESHSLVRVFGNVRSFQNLVTM